MDGTGAWHEVVFLESLWRTIKYEKVYPPRPPTPRKAGVGQLRVISHTLFNLPPSRTPYSGQKAYFADEVSNAR